MSFRPLTLLTAISMGLLIYLVAVVLIFHQITTRLITTFGSVPRSPPLYQNGWFNISGASIPLWVMMSVASILPTLWLTSAIFHKVERHRRDKLGLCLDCGYPIHFKRGRCPGCGARIV